LFRKNYIRAVKAAPERGFLLDKRTCHDCVDLSSAQISAADVHAAVSDVVRFETQFGFSYYYGHHCQEFSNRLFERIWGKFRTRMQKKLVVGRTGRNADEFDKINVLKAQAPCVTGKPLLGHFMAQNYPEMHASLVWSSWWCELQIWPEVIKGFPA
jgi:hypothetical protein